ncbi:hypothetical protein BX616_001617 [Lobosporangium transversale]|uniref:p-loop containing nucleoside triphosphate hydrolase protein n=1 Tax=Lobosporangium transversale TaxID=64571 RepID=A0A1Y2GYN5_9FUNG|nr:P-loop containing nucleoside triphosphate hydrolase protein [Lobosporangium transversale]KAF9917235.1 hypothetical protein BX616_001617 [Lobosporangium transversale]ORZ27386.1 P-loop containing nucleoside triphosphate hydrolase protein [Lobosporangium transversale]|eukprot:XP_021885113.1 P-loop containing nucleoside triphosphate hydrolase protein [Lobosporangium transversale]
MFEKTEYQNFIDKVNKIRSYGLNKMLTIPQIAILGDQSSGKSSVLEALTRLSFPRNIETCTRFATQVSLRQSPRKEMSAHIDGEAAFNKQYQAQEADWNIHTIISDANRILCSYVEISEKVLEITISGPTLSPLTVIDLPGYINTTVDGQDKSIVETIRTINTKYIKDSRTIILAVVPANVDLNNIFVLGEAERYDPKNERTIPIVTKPDTVEPDLLPNLIQTVLNKRKQMRLGYLVMKNSSYKDIDIPWEEAKKREDEFFKSSELWNQVPVTRRGRVHVKEFLGDLLYTHIKKELPFLRKDILDMIKECEDEITSMGPPVSSIATAKIKYIDNVMKLKSSLIALLDGNYTFEYINQNKPSLENQDSVSTGHGDSEDDMVPLSLEESSHTFLRSSLQTLYQRYNAVMNKDKYILEKDKISELVLRYKGKELPGFISFTTFTQIYMETLVRWSDMTKVHIANMHQYLYKAISRFIAFTADPLIKDTLLIEFDRFYSLQITKIESEIESIFIDEDTPFTMNKYYYDNILKSRKAKAEQKIAELAKLGTTPDEYTAEYIKKLLEQQLESYGNPSQISDVNYNEELAVEDLQEQLRSYCKVVRKRIVDVVLQQTIERHMIKRINLYFEMLIAVDEDTISSRLVEPPAKQERRQELQDKVAVLRKSLLAL